MGSIYEEYDAGMQQDVSFPGGVVMTLLADLHPRVQKVQEVIGKKYRHNLHNASPELKLRAEIERLQVTVAGWTGVKDRDGNDMPYTPENVAKLFTDLPWLMQEVRIAVVQKESFRKEAQALLGEASAPSSVPT